MGPCEAAVIIRNGIIMKNNDKSSILVDLDSQIKKAQERAAYNKAEYEYFEEVAILFEYLKGKIVLSASATAPQNPITKGSKRPLTRMRTIKEAIKELKESDPNCSLTESALRRMVWNKEITFVKVGSKYLINFDTLEEYLKTPPQKL